MVGGGLFTGEGSVGTGSEQELLGDERRRI